MKRKTKFIYLFTKALFVFLIISSCSKKDPSPNSTVSALTAIVTSDYLKGVAIDSGEVWIFASDKSGNVLDSHEITAAGTYQFISTTTDDSISLTSLIRYPDLSNSDFNINSFFFKRSSSVIFDAVFKRENPIPAITGAATITITNFELATYPSFTYILVSDGYNGLIANGLNAGTNVVPIQLRGDTTSFLISAHTANNQPVYTWAHHVHNGAAISVDFSSFLPFPQTFGAPDYTTYLEIDLAGLYDRQNAGQPVSGYDMATTFIDGGQSPGLHPLTGYLPGFDSYQMRINNGTCAYHKKGSLNTAYTLLSPHVNVVNGDFQNPSFSSDSKFTYRVHKWQGSGANINVMDWTLFAGKGTLPKISALPPNLLAKYPSLDLTKLVYINSTFIDNLDGYTYAQYLKDFLSGTQRNSYEYYSY